MRHLLIGIAACVWAGAVSAAPVTYTIDSDHTDIVWMVSHFGFSKSVGEFAKSNGTVVIDEAKPERSRVELEIDTASITTGSEKFDEHLKSKDFLQVQEYPNAVFKSTAVEVTGKDTARVTGDLTMLGQTHPVVLDVKKNKIGVNSFNKKQTAGFSARTQLDRTLWGINYGVPGIPSAVDLTIETEATVESDAAQ